MINYTLNGQGITGLYASRPTNTGHTPQEQCAYLAAADDKALRFYSVPYATDSGASGLRDLIEQLDWLMNYATGGHDSLDYIVRLEDGTFIPLTWELANEVVDA